MLFHADQLWLATVALVALRLAPLFMAAPGLSGSGVPLRVRLLLVAALAICLVSGRGLSGLAPPPLAEGAFLAAAVSEFLIGLAMLSGLLMAFAAFQLAGQVLDTQIGFGIANIFDPVTRSQSPLLGSALDMLAVVLFLGLDGHHMIIRGLARSLERVPLGTPLSMANLPVLAAQLSQTFAGALALAGPTLLAVLLVDVALAVMSRSMPQMNIFVLAMPIKIFLGLLVLGLSLGYLLPRVRNLFDSVWFGWERLWA